jgi:hypothetical protein
MDPGSMFMKYSGFIGVIGCFVLVGACFLPWAYYPDLGRTFSGFYSQNNIYGRPGRFFLVIAIVSVLLFLIPRIWAKRFNLLVAVIIVAYSIKTFVLYTACYRGMCPEKKPGLFLMLAGSLIILCCALLPDLKIQDPGEHSKTGEGLGEKTS